MAGAGAEKEAVRAAQGVIEIYLKEGDREGISFFHMKLSMGLGLGGWR